MKLFLRAILLALLVQAYLHSQVAISPWGKPQFFLSNGQPNANGFLSTFAAGTSTPLATYTDSAGISQNTVIIALDAAGRPPSGIYLGSSSYKFILTDASSSTIWTQDGINIPGLSISSLTVTTGNSLTLNAGSTTSIATNLLPDVDNARSVGAVGKTWANAYLNTIVATSTFTNSFQVTAGPSNIAGAFNLTGHLVFQSGAPAPQIDCTTSAASCQIAGATATNGEIALNPGNVASHASVIVTAARNDQPGLYGVYAATRYWSLGPNQASDPPGLILSGLAATDVSLTGTNGGIVAAGSLVSTTGALNAQVISMAAIAGTYGSIGVNKTGSGTFLPLALFTNNTEQVLLDTSGNLTVFNGNVTATVGNVVIPNIKSTTGQRYVCVTTTGILVSSASACSGT